nr:MAG TPA_asm: hypothetical protein [Caudoviricetes sp.]
MIARYVTSPAGIIWNPIGSQPSMASASCGVEPRKSTVWELTAPGSGPKNSLLF